jgi:hypothetical protein
MTPAPGLLGQVLCRLFFNPNERMEPVTIDQPLSDGEILPIAGGIEAIHTPGHYAGHLALLWRPGRMLFAGDVEPEISCLTRETALCQSRTALCSAAKTLSSRRFLFEVPILGALS